MTDYSDAYRAKRAELLDAEIALMQQQEHVAEMRRALPLDTIVDDYKLEGPNGSVALSELFTSPDRTLVTYHYMFGKAQTSPCPMCTMWIDGYNAVAEHLAQRIDFAIVGAGPFDALQQWASSRGWDNLRLFTDGSTFKRDLGSEDVKGNQDSLITVFRQTGDGNVVLFYGAHPHMSDDIHERGIDLLTPVWNMLDLTPEGRGEDWYPSTSYRKE